ECDRSAEARFFGHLVTVATLGARRPATGRRRRVGDVPGRDEEFVGPDVGVICRAERLPSVAVPYAIVQEVVDGGGDVHRRLRKLGAGCGGEVVRDLPAMLA